MATDETSPKLKQPIPAPTAPGRDTFWRKRGDGSLEEIDVITGATVRVSAGLKNPQGGHFNEVEIGGRTVLVQEGIPVSTLDSIGERYPHSEALEDVICQKIMDGVKFSKVHLERGIPDRGTLMRWKREHASFAEKLKIAKQYRAEALRDEALDFAYENRYAGKDAVPAHKHYTDLLVWGAEKDDPEVYGKSVKVDAKVGVMQMIVDTGIRREDEDVKDVVEQDTVEDEVVEVDDHAGERDGGPPEASGEE